MRIHIRDGLGAFLRHVGLRIGIDLPYFIKNGGWAFLRQVGVNGLAFLVTILFTHIASQMVYGKYQLVLSILATLSVFSLPGMNTSLMMAVAKGKDGNYREVVRSSIKWSVIGAPVLVFIGMYFSLYGERDVGLALMVSAIFFPFMYAPNTWDSFLMGKSRFDIAAKYSFIHALINSILTVGAVIFFRDSVVYIVGAYLFSYAFFNAVYYALSTRFIENEEKDDAVHPYGYFLTRINVLSIIADNFDKVLVGTFLLPSRLAVFSVGIMFTRQIQTLSKGILAVFIPKQVQYGEIPKGGYTKLFIFGLTVSVICLAAFGFIIPFLLPSSYDESITVAKISVAFYPFFLISNIYSNQFIFNNNKAVLLNYTAINSFLRLALTAIVLPLFGILGLAALSGIQQVLSTMLLYGLSMRHERGRRLLFNAAS